METVFVITTLASEQIANPPAAPLDAVQTISLLLGTLYPILVGLITKVSTTARTKSLLLAGLSIVSGVVSEWIADPSVFVWQQALLTAVLTFVTAVASYYGLIKPTGVAAKAQHTLVK